MKYVHRFKLCIHAGVISSLIAALTLLPPTSLLAEPLQKGVEYKRFELKDPYRRVHTIAIDRKLIGSTYRLQFQLSASGLLEREKLTDLIELFESGGHGKVSAAINGTWLSEYRSLGAIPRGPLIIDHHLVTASTWDPTHPALFFGPSGEMYYATLDIDLLVLRQSGERIKLGLNAPRRGSMGLVLNGSYSKTSGKPGAFSIPGDFPRPYYILRPNTEQVSHIQLPEADKPFGIVGSYSVHPALSESTPELLARELAILFTHELPAEALLEDEQVQVAVRARVRENSTVKNSCTPAQKDLHRDSVVSASGVGKVLVESLEFGARVPDYIKTVDTDSRNPRSAICWNDSKVFFVTADGMRPGARGLLSFLTWEDRSQGITPVELSQFLLRELKCKCGVELDGGKSSSLYLRDEIVNYPATGFEFPTNAALLLVSNGDK